MKGMMKNISRKDTFGRVKDLMKMAQSGQLSGEAPLKQRARSERGRMTGKDLAKSRKAERQRKKQNRKK